MVRLQPGSMFAGYTIRRLLGAGGMGVVYLAGHPRLDRQVALKVLSDALSADVRVRARFEREAALASRLDHANIVPVYDRSGPGDENLWLSMKYVDGGDANELLAAAGRLPAPRATRLIAEAAQGLDYAHRQGVLHRDIKPANLLVARDGEGVERALITDFGIARTLDDTVTLSGLTASIAYTAPERFRGEPGDQRADIYSLGCTLYQLLTGRTPFERTNQAAVISAHLNDAPPRPTALQPGLPPGFDDVIATAMAKDPGDRYPSCTAMAIAADQILAYAQRETVVRQPLPPTRRLEDRTGRGGSPAPRSAVELATRAQTSDVPLELLCDTGNVWSLAFSPDGALLAVPNADTVDLWDPRTRRSVGRPLTGHRENVAAVAFSPDGTLIATGSWDHTARLWDARTRRPVGPPLTGHTDWVQSVAFSPDGSLLVTGSSDKSLRVWNVGNGALFAPPVTGDDAIHAVACQPSGTLIAAGGVGFTIGLWNVATRRPEPGRLTGLGTYVSDLAFSPDGTLLASGHWNSTVWLWDLRTRRRIGDPWPGHTDWVRTVTFSPDGTVLASGGDDQNVLLRDVRTGRAVAARSGEVGAVQSLAFSPARPLLALGGDAVRLWDLGAD